MHAGQALYILSHYHFWWFDQGLNSVSQVQLEKVEVVRYGTTILSSIPFCSSQKIGLATLQECLQGRAVVAHAFNPSIWEADTGRSSEFEAHNEALFQK